MSQDRNVLVDNLRSLLPGQFALLLARLKPFGLTRDLLKESEQAIQATQVVEFFEQPSRSLSQLEIELKAVLHSQTLPRTTTARNEQFESDGQAHPLLKLEGDVQADLVAQANPLAPASQAQPSSEPLVAPPQHNPPPQVSSVWRCDPLVVLGSSVRTKHIFDSAGLVGYGEVRLMIEILLQKPHLISSFRFDKEILHSGERKQNLIILGGRHGNDVSYEILKNKKTLFDEMAPGPVKSWIHDSGKLITGNTNREHYGHVYKRPNPFNPEKFIIICSGNLGYGTWAAGRYFLDKAVQIHSLDEVEVVLKTQIVFSEPTNIQILRTDPLDSLD